MGTGPDVLNAANPELIVDPDFRLRPDRSDGAHRPGFAAVAEAYGGFRELVGDPGRPPVRMGVSIGDTIAGLYAAFGSVMSLFERETKRGETRRLRSGSG